MRTAAIACHAWVEDCVGIAAALLALAVQRAGGCVDLCTILQQNQPHLVGGRLAGELESGDGSR